MVRWNQQQRPSTRQLKSHGFESRRHFVLSVHPSLLMPTHRSLCTFTHLTASQAYTDTDTDTTVLTQNPQMIFQMSARRLLLQSDSFNSSGLHPVVRMEQEIAVPATTLPACPQLVSNDICTFQILYGLLSPAVTICTTYLNNQQLCILPHSVFIGPVWFTE
jgi:hypothetical protein